MGSKYFDFIIAAVMAFFAYTRFMSGNFGFAGLFALLFILNMITGIVKHRKGQNSKEIEENIIK